MAGCRDQIHFQRCSVRSRLCGFLLLLWVLQSDAEPAFRQPIMGEMRIGPRGAPTKITNLLRRLQALVCPQFRISAH